MPPLLSSFVIVSDNSFRSDDPEDIVQSNISYINALRSNGVSTDDIPVDAMRSYIVDFYWAQLCNGGFSQFVYNCRWKEDVITLVRSGLAAMEADPHVRLLDRGAAVMQALGPTRTRKFLESNYFGDNKEREEIDAATIPMLKPLFGTDDLIRANAAFLRRLPNLKVLAIADMEEEVARRTADIHRP